MEDIGAAAIKVIYKSARVTSSSLMNIILELTKKNNIQLNKDYKESLNNINHINLPEPEAQYMEKLLLEEDVKYKIQKVEDGVFSIYFYGKDIDAIHKGVAKCAEVIIENRKKESLQKQHEQAKNKAKEININRQENRQFAKSIDRIMER